MRLHRRYRISVVTLDSFTTAIVGGLHQALAGRILSLTRRPNPPPVRVPTSDDGDVVGEWIDASQPCTPAFPLLFSTQASSAFDTRELQHSSAQLSTAQWERYHGFKVSSESRIESITRLFGDLRFPTANVTCPEESPIFPNTAAIKPVHGATWILFVAPFFLFSMPLLPCLFIIRTVTSLSQDVSVQGHTSGRAC